MASAEPDAAGGIVVFWTRRPATCDDCAKELSAGSFIRVQDGVARCLECADLGDLIFLPRGDAALTRRAAKHSRLSAVVVRWSSSRRRYERQGLLVEEPAIERAEAECLSDAGAREARRLRSAEGRTLDDEHFVRDFAGAIRRRFGGCPEDVAEAIARHACARSSGRIGRTAAARTLSEDAIDLAVRAHIRHVYSPYDDYLMRGWDRGHARETVRPIVDKVVAGWRGPAGEAARHG